MRAAAASEKGCFRTRNEDCFGIDARLGLLVIADGLGGHNAGDVAARMAVEAVAGWVGHVLAASPADTPPSCQGGTRVAGDLLRAAIHEANNRIQHAAAGAREYAGMGTTIAAAIVGRSCLSVAHVGDSRVYLLTARGLKRLTRDDTWLASVEAAERGAVVDPGHPLRHALTNAVGSGRRADVHLLEQPLEGSELIVMTTDGVHGTLSDRALERLLAGAESVAAAASRLVSAALAAGSRDNCTVVVARSATAEPA